MRPFPEASYAGESDGKASARPRIPPILRPRLTWRYIFSVAILSYVLYCFLFSLPLFASPLPMYSGPYPVGAIDIESPVSHPRVVDTTRFKDSNEKPFELQTVLFTLYYPAVHGKSHAKKHRWIPKPVSVTAKGYAKFAHISNFLADAIFTGALRTVAGGIKIPAKVDASLAELAPPVASHPDTRQSQELEKVASIEEYGHPIIVFSHGMASSRTDYTHYAGEMASRGFIVVMLEHRDGSCPGSIVMTDGQMQPKFTFKRSEVESAEGEELEADDFNRAQLSFREAEIEEAVRVLRDINDGKGAEIFKQNLREEGQELADWAGRLNVNEMVMAGHSFGATGALQALKGGPTEKRPFIGAIVLDPGKQSGRLNHDIDVPLLVVHSNSWSSKHSVFYGRAHFDVVRALVEENNDKRGNPSWFMTSLGTSHPSVTDAPILEPTLLSWTTGAKIDVHEGLRQYVHLSEDFLWFLKHGEKRNLLAEKAEFPEYDAGKGFGIWKPGQGDNEKEGGQWWDWRKYWQVHVSPHKDHTSKAFDI
ncbi:PAF acetylhydrolase [Xylaria arbuscula]|nr:PAF acetylhydrolase [Xylaria arbuscula]